MHKFVIITYHLLLIICFQIIDLDTGRTLGPNQDGEMCIRGPTVMKGERNESPVEWKGGFSMWF